MSRKSEIRKIWDELDREAENQFSGICKRIIPNSSSYRIYVGTNAYSKTNLFIIEFPIEDTSLFDQINDSKGLQISVDLFGDEQPGCNSCRIISTNIKVNDIFCLFAEDIITFAECITNKAKYTMNVIERLKLWKVFFETNKGRELSKSEQIGLYGELFFLEKLILKSGLSIIQNWKGPLRAAQDFQFMHSAIEIKSTTNEYSNIVHINNAKQLDIVNRKILFLVYNQFEAYESNGDTLPDIIKRIKLTSAQTEWCGVFEKTLFEQGYIEDDNPKYKTGYIIRKQLIYNVSLSFPKLTSNNLPYGICDISYDLDLDECSSYKVDFNFLCSNI